MNSFTLFSSTGFSNLPSILNVVAHTAPSEALNCLTMLSLLVPVLQNIGVFLTELFTIDNTWVSVSYPAVKPLTQIASGRQLNSVVLAICAISLSVRYFAASGTMLYNIFI